VPAVTCIAGVQTAIVAATGDVTPPLTTVSQVNKGSLAFVSTSQLA
jgi:hypothetical protein